MLQHQDVTMLNCAASAHHLVAPGQIDAVIAEHREAWSEYGAEAAFFWKKGRSSSNEARATRDAYEAATAKFVQTPIHSLADLTAFAAYLASLRAYGGSKVAPLTYAIE